MTAKFSVGADDAMGFAPLEAGRRERDAGPRRRAVDPHRAGAADAVLAANVGRSQRLMLAQEVDEVQPRLDLGLNAASVDGERQCFHDALAWLAARFSATRARL